MTDRVYQGDSYFEVSLHGRSFELHVDFARDVRVAVSEDRENVMWISAEEATMLKNFLVEQGF